MSTDKTSSQDISVDYWYNSFGILLEEKDIFVSSIPQTHISYEYLWDIGDFSTNSNKDINNSIYKVVNDGHRTPKLTTWYDLLGREVKTEQDGYANHTIRSINKHDNSGEYN